MYVCMYVGDRVRAIKCLVRSGDTKAVIQFASISRNQEIYTLAANYLQQMNWREVRRSYIHIYIHTYIQACEYKYDLVILKYNHFVFFYCHTYMFIQLYST